MADPARELESKVLRLPSKARARLAELLIASLDAESDPEAERLWLEEAERRLAALESGGIEAVSAGQVFEDARRRLR